ncbi:hypothetical protein K502DRAFT_332524 [Neoconidiobolus thromboides FSU 785]|nr:hypothetical protein K502DRAFT_332524 [Neoconidiobolus thromboides FSU 785]
MENKNQSRSFVSENTLEEIKKRREESGISNTKESNYDPRTLFERLKEQRAKKEEAIEEANKLGNRIHRLDEDESEYLIELIEKEKRIKLELETKEKEEVLKFKELVANNNVTKIPKLDIKKEVPATFVIKKNPADKQNINTNSSKKKTNPLFSKLIKTKIEPKDNNNTDDTNTKVDTNKDKENDMTKENKMEAIMDDTNKKTHSPFMELCNYSSDPEEE